VDHRQWLEKRLSEEFEGETTVITHHAPHLKALKGTPAIGPCYASDLEALILKYQPERWLHGHTHHRVAFSVGRTSLINISIGYPGQMDLIDDLAPFTFELEE
jgi:Icc-related predicted phosphoesterase